MTLLPFSIKFVVNLVKILGCLIRNREQKLGLLAELTLGFHVPGDQMSLQLITC